MPQNTDYNLLPGQPTLITDADVSVISVQNRSRSPVLFQATVGTTPPASWLGAREVFPGQNILTDTPLATVWPGVPGANRVFALASAPSLIVVSHA
jgi:hypothetical protein